MKIVGFAICCLAIGQPIEFDFSYDVKLKMEYIFSLIRMADTSSILKLADLCENKVSFFIRLLI